MLIGGNMSAWEKIRQRIKELAETNPKIHITVTQKRPLQIHEHEAEIKKIYPNLFRIQSEGAYYSVQYTDVLTKTVWISELEDLFKEIEASEEKNQSRAGHRKI